MDKAMADLMEFLDNLELDDRSWEEIGADLNQNLIDE